MCNATPPRQDSRRTIDSYLYWIKLFILFSGKQHPSGPGDEHINRTQRQRKLPVADALARKYPSAPFAIGWHYLFPASC
jgi:hypothetical protein